MKLPESVRVAHVDIKICEWDQLESSVEHMWGSFIAAKMQINVTAQDRQFHEVLCTLLHEINHAIFWAYLLQDDDKEERICDVMAVGWAQVYRDNPQIVRFIFSQGAQETIEEWEERLREAHRDA